MIAGVESQSGEILSFAAARARGRGRTILQGHELVREDSGPMFGIGLLARTDHDDPWLPRSSGRAVAKRHARNCLRTRPRSVAEFRTLVSRAWDEEGLKKATRQMGRLVYLLPLRQGGPESPAAQMLQARSPHAEPLNPSPCGNIGPKTTKKSIKRRWLVLNEKVSVYIPLGTGAVWLWAWL